MGRSLILMTAHVASSPVPVLWRAMSQGYARGRARPARHPWRFQTAMADSASGASVRPRNSTGSRLSGRGHGAGCHKAALSGGMVGDTHDRRPIEGFGAGVEGAPVHRLIAGGARPGVVAAP